MKTYSLFLLRRINIVEKLLFQIRIYPRDVIRKSSRTKESISFGRREENLKIGRAMFNDEINVAIGQVKVSDS